MQGKRHRTFLKKGEPFFRSNEPAALGATPPALGWNQLRNRREA